MPTEEKFVCPPGDHFTKSIKAFLRGKYPDFGIAQDRIGNPRGPRTGFETLRNRDLLEAAREDPDYALAVRVITRNWVAFLWDAAHAGVIEDPLNHKRALVQQVAEEKQKRVIARHKALLLFEANAEKRWRAVLERKRRLAGAVARRKVSRRAARRTRKTATGDLVVPPGVLEAAVKDKKRLVLRAAKERAAESAVEELRARKLRKEVMSK